jgi:hypothetical protein
MKESLSKLDRKLIFRETFSSEMDCRANGGVPTGVIFKNGNALITGASTRLVFPSIRTSEFSFRIKFKLLTVKAQSFLCGIFTVVNYEWIGVGSTGSNKITISNKANAFTSSLTSLTANKWYDVIITANSTSTKIYIDGILDQTGVAFVGKTTFNQMSYIPGQSNFDMNTNVELMEFYEGTLTPQEVKNLYQNKRYKKLAPHGEILSTTEFADTISLENGSNLFSTVGDTVIATYTSNTVNPLSGTKDTLIQVTSIGTSGIRPLIGLNSTAVSPIVSGKLYRTKFDYRVNSGLCKVSIRNGSSSYGTAVTLTGSGTSTIYTYALDNVTAIGTLSFDGRNLFNVQIDNLSFKEVLSKAELVMDIDAFDGVIKNRMSGGFNGNEAIINGNFIDASNWIIQSTPPWIISNEKASYDATSNIKGIYQGTSSRIVANKPYRLSFTISDSSGLAYLKFSDYSNNNKNFTSLVGYGNGIYNLDVVAPYNWLSSDAFAIYAYNNGGSFSIGNISIKEVIPSVVNTAVTVVNDGGVKAMRFNGSTSRLDCGSYNGLIGDITINAWVKVDTLGGLGYGRIIDNGQFLYSTNNGLTLIAKNSVATYATSGAFKKSIIFNTILTRTSSGLINFYINGILSSTANQVSSIPVAGGNIYIGNSLANNTGWNGNIIHLQIYNGILSQQEISQLYSSNKSKFNL